VRVGVIGVGHLGQHHARIYAGLPGAKLMGVTDLDPLRSRLVAERHRVVAYADAAALLKEVEAVSVAVPTSAHYSVAKTCLDTDVHVLVEKPIATTIEEAQELIEVAKRRGRVLQVGHVERFNPVLMAARPYIAGPKFIECQRRSPFSERGTDVDVVLDLMIHDLDIVLSLEPGPVEEVRAAGMSVLSATNDIANARIAFRSGCVANLTASRVSSTRLRKMRVFQTDGYLSIDYHSRQGLVYRRRAESRGRLALERETLTGGASDALTIELEGFLRAASTGARPVVSGEDGVAALALAHQVLDQIDVFTQCQQSRGVKG
jgi:predicted dehydrogenase